MECQGSLCEAEGSVVAFDIACLQLGVGAGRKQMAWCVAGEGVWKGAEAAGARGDRDSRELVWSAAQVGTGGGPESVRANFDDVDDGAKGVGWDLPHVVARCWQCALRHGLKIVILLALCSLWAISEVRAGQCMFLYAAGEIGGEKGGACWVSWV